MYLDREHWVRNLVYAVVFSAVVYSIFGLMLLAPALASVAVAFGSAEYFLLMLLALVMVSNLTTGSQLKALIATLFGLSIAMVGIDPRRASSGSPSGCRYSPTA